MPTDQMSMVFQRLFAALGRDGAGLTDGELLNRFLKQRDDAALADLVRRHASMVWGVCRRLLRNHHDAEDAFQATFLVLVRKAATIRDKEMVANWLYGVAHQTAVRLRVTAAKRGVRERQVVDMPEPVVDEARADDLLPLLDQELSRLPEKFRVLIVLCDLEGKTRKEVARQLGCPEGTVASRLARARTMLAKRLTQRGVALSGGALAAVLAQQAVSAGVPNSVVDSTIKAASLLAAGKAATTGAISVKVAVLTEGVMKAMLFTKLKAAIAVVLILGFVATGATILACRTAAGQEDKKPAAEKPVEPAAKQQEEKEAFTAWGKEINGLQAGLGFRPGQKRAYHHGEEATVVLRVRNVGKEAVEFKHIGAFFVENPPTITDADGKRVQLPRLLAEGLQQPHTTTVAPGKEVNLYEWNIHLLPKGATSKNLLTIPGTGKFSLQCERVVGPTSFNPNHPNPTLDKLATGKLELEVKEAEKVPDKKERENKEGFTAWGKEIDGLQAGLGYLPGQHRTYYTGETVTLVVRVRNVGKEAVKFQYNNAFFDMNPPSVIDGEGKSVAFAKFDPLGRQTPSEAALAPGEEVDLYEWKPALRPVKERDNKKPNFSTTLYGTGKFSIQFERVSGNSALKLDPILSKLATGKLELEIKSEPPPANEKKPPQKQEKEKEGLTAWGKEAGGLQAGLGFRPGEKRAYSHGETATVVLRVRNSGKEAVECKHIYAFFLENPPTITDADGKMVELRKGTDEGRQMPRSTSVAPGKEVELHKWEFDLQPEGGINKALFTIHGTGKFSLQCERVVGPTSGNPNHPNPALDKLATGKLELEVKDAEKNVK